ncbi:response regulator [Myceligenerans pegani]|uniref:Transcriptional regulatory protein n=1 Tax=Myceligenerans pegani TaxID=2776917 RepID=A0ABR9MWQ5_9MICO|nr:response regulator [Myceligenerans sp. TRM 65318]MBE1875825.1 response regulator [Myceligenerans sp. TRM 65318]MBE3018096.1 response regulator [Myceligenerans sp. TRM 65318]
MTAPTRTLVVEDDPAVALVHRGFVESHPRFVVVGEARNGTDALRLAAALRPDLVLLDLHLPGMGGLDVLRRLRLLPGEPIDVVATTAARELDSVRQAMAGGVVAYLVKPFTSAALRERLDEVWQRREDLRRARDTLDQDEVDLLLAGPRAATAAPPKGLSGRSRALVQEALARLCGAAGADASAAEVAETVGMSRVSARRYLEHLVAEGHARVAPRYGATGRPENRYRPA